MTVASRTIRINDLRNPVLTIAHRKALQEAERHPIELTDNAILAASRQATGLDDFGPDDFRDRLQHLLKVIKSDPNRTALSHAKAFQYCVGLASTRLLLEDLLKRHPEICDAHIHQPVIIVGPPRSGTTHLQGLLAADSRLRSLSRWECLEPIPRRGETAASDEGDPRLSRYVERCRQWQEQVPHAGAFHPAGPNDVAEEFSLQGPDFPSWLWGSATTVSHPSKPEIVDDHARHYQYMKTMLKALQWQRGPNRWVLKSPLHCDHLGTMLSCFPDATVVMTHRDPISLIQSAATGMSYIARLHYREIDTDLIAGSVVDRIESMLRTIINRRESVSEDRIIDVLFHEFMADEIGTAERVYTAADMDMTDVQRHRLVSYLNKQPRGKHGQVVYNLRKDFGLEPSDLRSRFSFYYENFSVKIEVQ